jgi:hypothetical protein
MTCVIVHKTSGIILSQGGNSSRNDGRTAKVRFAAVRAFDRVLSIA